MKFDISTIWQQKKIYRQIFYRVELYLVRRYAETQKNKNCEYCHKNCTKKLVYFPEIKNTINM